MSVDGTGTGGLASSGPDDGLRLRASHKDGTSSDIYVFVGLTIGRSPGNTIVIPEDPGFHVARTHARVEDSDAGLQLRCLESGTQLLTADGPVSTIPLAVGATFEVGASRFEVIASTLDASLPAITRSDACPFCRIASIGPADGRPAHCPACAAAILTVPEEKNFGIRVVLPAVFGGHRADMFVARGGMGYVLKGTSPEGLPVAIKVLVFDRAVTQQSRARFDNEVQLLRRMHDPNVLRLITSGEEASHPYLVTEWVQGHDLRAELPDRSCGRPPAPFSMVLRWLEQACLGLSAIHRAGAIHRDVKPSNLILRSDGDLLVADLGVAKRLEDDETGMTSTGQLPGTYLYMAPEQHVAPDTVDERTDIYSLGVTFYELLTGQRPQIGMPPPSHLNPDVPAEFDQVIMTMLAGRMVDRPASMMELFKTLARFTAVRDDDAESFMPEPPVDPAVPAGATKSARSRMTHGLDALGDVASDAVRFGRRIVETVAGKSSTSPVDPTTSAVEVATSAAVQDLTTRLDSARAMPPTDPRRLEELKAVRRSLDLAPSHERVSGWDRELRKRVDQLLRADMLQIGDDAYHARRYGVAAAAYDELIRLGLGDQAVQERIGQICAYREVALDKALDDLKRNNVPAARKRVRDIGALFPNDAPFVSRCEQFIARCNRIEFLVREEIPTLQSSRRYFRLVAATDELAALQVDVRGLDELRSRLRVKIAEAVARLADARRMLAEGRLDEARLYVGQARQLVPDHPDLDATNTAIESAESHRSSLVDRVKKLREQGRFCAVHAILRGESAFNVQRLGLSQLRSQANDFKARSDRFLMLLAWSLLGTVVVTVTASIAGHLCDRVGRMVQAFATMPAINFRFLWTVRLVVAVCTATGLLYGIREILAQDRKVRHGAVDAIAIGGLSIVLLGAVMGRNWLETRFAAQEAAWLFQLLTMVFVGLITWAFWCAVVAGFSRAGLDVVASDSALSPAFITLLGAVLTFGMYVIGPGHPAGGFASGTYPAADTMRLALTSLLTVLGGGAIMSSLRPGALLICLLVGPILGLIALTDGSTWEAKNTWTAWGTWMFVLTAAGLLTARTRDWRMAVRAITFATLLGTIVMTMCRMSADAMGIAVLMPWSCSLIVLSAAVDGALHRRLHAVDRVRYAAVLAPLLQAAARTSRGPTRLDSPTPFHDGVSLQDHARLPPPPMPPGPPLSATPPALPRQRP